MENEVDYYESKKLAQCFISPLSETIPIPSNIFSSLKPLGENFVAVIPGDSKKLSFFITNASQVLFVRLILDKASLNDKFFKSLRTNLLELELENLFSTGLCFKDDACVWEGVFEYDDDSNYKTDTDKLAKVAHVNNSKFDIIKINS